MEHDTTSSESQLRKHKHRLLNLPATPLRPGAVESAKMVSSPRCTENSCIPRVCGHDIERCILAPAHWTGSSACCAGGAAADSTRVGESGGAGNKHARCPSAHAERRLRHRACRSIAILSGRCRRPALIAPHIIAEILAGGSLCSFFFLTSVRGGCRHHRTRR